jgi:hypothetical protein
LQVRSLSCFIETLDIMKHIINKQLIGLVGLILLSTFFITCSSEKQIDSSFSQEEITQAINNDRWIFTADYATPSYGSSRSLTSGYNVICRSKDTLDVALPYYGRLNSPAGAFSGNPLDFKSNNFTLAKEQKKAGEWLVTIKSVNSEVQSMNFTFFDNGTAQLNIIMTNRSGINFSGKVGPVKSFK